MSARWPKRCAICCVTRQKDKSSCWPAWSAQPSSRGRKLPERQWQCTRRRWVSEPEPSSAAKVWVVVVNWNGREDTLTCLASIMRSTLRPVHILVVDNGSMDDSVQAIRTCHPTVEVLEAGENLGFGRANNLGAERFLDDPSATHLFLLNNDATVAENTLERMVNAMGQNRWIGAVVPKIYYMDSPRRLWYAGGTIDWRQGSALHRGIDQEDIGQFDDARLVSFATGCGLLLGRAAVEQVGLFDPRYFFFGEDVDLSLRLLQAGYAILYCPDAVIWHKVGYSARRWGGAFTYYHMTRNRLLTMRKHACWHHWVQFGFYFPLLWGWQAVKAVARDEDFDVWWGIWRGVWDFAAGRFERREP
ncbi:MAG: glycosyltransferase family 2 protein [Chloroflexi bacterium]|nr:MAG: glycosyltransferase family 2 protein [Chloroflexota bacterium]